MLPAYKSYQATRRRLITEYKNPLLKATAEQLAVERLALEAQLQAFPYNIELRTKLELLTEVEMDR